MVYRFTFVSDEDDTFLRIIDIDSEATFFDLHKAILASVGYNEEQITSFFLCNDNWEKGQEITLVEMESSPEYDNLVMDATHLDELISDEKQKLFYVFDPMFERGFYGELSEIITGRSVDAPKCITAEGKAPMQLMDEQDIMPAAKATNSLDEDFYGDEDFDLDELDEQGFQDMNFEDGYQGNDF